MRQPARRKWLIPRMVRRVLATAAAVRFLCFLFFTLPLAAQTLPGDLKSLVAEALHRNPEIQAAQKKYEASRLRPSQVSSLPDPMISPSYASTKPWPGGGIGSVPAAGVGLMVSQEIPYPGKRKLAGEIAEREADAEFQSYQQVQLAVISRLKQAYFQRAWAFTSVSVLDRNIALLEKLVKITEARYAVGKAAQQDILKAQTQISMLGTRRVQLEREKQARAAEILSLLNLPPTVPLPPPDPLTGRAITVSLEQLSAAARKNNPLVLRDEKRIQRAELAVNLARKEFYPDVTLKAGYDYMGSMPDIYRVGIDVKLPLYFFRKQRPGLAERATEEAASRQSFEATAQSVLFRIKDDLLMAQTSAQLVDLYADRVLPQANLTLESSLASYESGSVDFLTVLMNYIAVVEYEMNYYDELASENMALARLEEMTATSILP
jgi:cobalt-zinc-cadmium efflux system outer membrane protein